MNFNDLYKTIRAIDENAQPVAPVHTDAPNTEEGIEIIGGPLGMPGHQEAPKQQDTVSMNVSLNGSGADGVRSLMNILKDIEDGEVDQDKGHALFGEPSDEEEPIMGDMVDAMSHAQDEEECYTSMEEEMGDDGESWGNSAHGDSGHHTHGIDAVTFSGDDMHSKGKVSPLARAPGTNPLQHPMHETLVDRLSQMYDTIKEDEKKTMSRAAKGVMKYGKDGMKALAKAGKEGKDLDKVRDKYNKYDEAYNPNSAAAQHARDMKAHTKKELEKAAATGDEKAKARLKRFNDRQDAMRAEYDARMERESVELSELAKWRDPKYKDKLYTQTPRDDDDYYQSDDDYYNPKPDNYPGPKHLKGGGEYDHNDHLQKGYGRGGVGALNTHGKRKGLPSRDHITSLKGSIKDAHGKHPTPKLPEQMNESKELNDIIALTKILRG